MAFATLPDSFPVYRGYAGKRGKGLCWTTKKKKAIWFARRFAMLAGHGEPRFRSGVAKKGDVLAYFTRRKEWEVVIDPEKVKQKKTKML